MSEADSSDSFAVRLKKSFLFRAQAVFFGRLAINTLYCLLFILSLGDNTIKFSHSFFDIIIILFAIFYAYFCHHLKEHKNLKYSSHFITLIFDLIILIYFTSNSGYLLSPLMAIHPFITAICLLLFQNPLMIMVPLLSIPLSTLLTVWGSNDPSFLSILYAMMLLCMLDALAIFFIYLVASQEQQMMHSLLALEKELQQLAILKERQRIAREFHDGIGAQLTSIVMQCDYLKRRLKQSEIICDINEIQNCAIESIDDMRRSITFLNNDFDIAEQITILCQNIATRHKICIKINNLDLLRALSLEQQLATCRIVQEGLTNALKHANAHEIAVSALYENGRLTLAVKDDGHGFDTSCHHPNRYGLSNLKARAEQIGGQLVIESLADVGTKIELTIAI